MMNKDDLINFGMIEVTDYDGALYPMEKVIIREDDGGSPVLSLAVSMAMNTPLLVLITPGGDVILGGIDSIEQLRAIENAITAYDSHY